MTSLITTLLITTAAIVGAQISALPQCGVICGLQAANATSCVPIADINCTCQYANQAIISPILRACLADRCDSDAQSSAAIMAGENICKTISQTASSMPSSSMQMSSMESSSMESSMTMSHDSSATATASPTRSALPTTARDTSATASATRSTSASASAATTSAAASGAAARPTAGVEALVAVAGILVLGL